jgi:hypothetical protein
LFIRGLCKDSFPDITMLSELSVKWMPDTTTRHRYRVDVGVLGALLAHVIEVWLFAFGYYFMVNDGTFGTLQRNFSNTLADGLYNAGHR